MTNRRISNPSRQKKQKNYPGWLWMIFGLMIGLSVALAVYIKNDEKVTQLATIVKAPTNIEGLIKNDSEPLTILSVQDEPIVARFDFYKMLPAFEMIIADEGLVVDEDIEPVAINAPGIYMLQAGAFSTHIDADRRRATLALHGIESRVQHALVNSRDYFRVYIGPIEDLEELNMTRSRLRENKIDVMRIKLSD